MCLSVIITRTVFRHRRSTVPSPWGCAPPYGAVEAWAEPGSHDGEAGPAWAAPTGPPRMQSRTAVRSRRARTEVGRSWSRRRDLGGGGYVVSDDGSRGSGLRASDVTHSAWWKPVGFASFWSCASEWIWCPRRRRED